MLEGLSEDKRVAFARFVDAMGPSSKALEKILSPIALRLAKEQAYQSSRDKLIPKADAHAEALYTMTRSLWPKAHKLTQTQERDLEKIRTLAFYNEMQRLAFHAHLIAYDPDKASNYKSERDLVAKVSTKYFGKKEAA